MLAVETGWCRGAARPAPVPPVSSPREGGEGSEDLIVRPSGRASPAGGVPTAPPAGLFSCSGVGESEGPGREAARPLTHVAGTRSALCRLRLPEDLRQLVDRVEQLLALRRVLGPLRVAGLLRGVPEELVELRVVLEVLGL